MPFEIIGVAAGILAVVAALPYIFDIFKGRAKPERASWLIWSALAVIAFFSQAAKGATSSLWLTGLDSLASITIFALSVKWGVGGFTRRDIFSLGLAAVGLLLWCFTNDSLYALLIVMGVDALGTGLTVIKTYQDPSTETYTMWVVLSLASLLGIVSVGRFDIQIMAYPIYLFAANAAVVIAKLLATSNQRRVPLS